MPPTIATDRMEVFSINNSIKGAVDYVKKKIERDTMVGNNVILRYKSIECNSSKQSPSLITLIKKLSST